MQSQPNPRLTPEVLALCAQHGADERFLTSIEYLDGTEYLKLFIEECRVTEPGSTSKETMLDIAISKGIATEGIVIPGIPYKPFRFCSP